MKILLANKYATVTGGADRHVLELAELLAGRGHEVRLLAFGPPGEPPIAGAYPAASVTSETRASVGLADLPRLGASLAWNGGVASAMRGLLDDVAPDVVHIHKIYPQISVAPIVLAARRDVPVVQTAHDYEFVSASAADNEGRRIDSTSPAKADRIVNTATLFLRRRLHVPRVDRWIVASQYMGEVHRRAGIEATVIPLFTAPPQGSPPAFGERAGFAFAGRLDARKGLPELFALARAEPRVGMTIAGMGELAEAVRREAEALPNLEFAGRLAPEEVGALYARHRVALMPGAWEEPAGLAALEAMAAGTPVVAFASGGLSEYVKRAGGGIVVPRGDSHGFRRAALSLISDEARWSELSEGGRRGVSELHGPDAYAAALEKVYAEALESRGR